MRETAISAWGSITRTCVTRRLNCEVQCWPPVEEFLAGTRPLTGKEAARAAEAVSLLVLPMADHQDVSEKGTTIMMINISLLVVRKPSSFDNKFFFAIYFNCRI